MSPTQHSRDCTFNGSKMWNCYCWPRTGTTDSRCLAFHYLVGSTSDHMADTGCSVLGRGWLYLGAGTCMLPLLSVYINWHGCYAERGQWCFYRSCCQRSPSNLFLYAITNHACSYQGNIEGIWLRMRTKFNCSSTPDISSAVLDTMSEAAHTTGH